MILLDNIRKCGKEILFKICTIFYVIHYHAQYLGRLVA